MHATTRASGHAAVRAVAHAAVHTPGSVDDGAPRENSDSEDESDTPSTLKSRLFRLIPSSTRATVVIFGADGDLSSRKILPAVFDLWTQGHLPHDVLLFGFARPRDGGGTLSTESEFRQHVRSHVQLGRGRDEVAISEFAERCHYVTGQFSDANAMQTLLREIEAQESRRRKLRNVSAQWLHATKRHADEADVAAERDDVRMYYLALPPFLYAQVTNALYRARAEMCSSQGGDASPYALSPNVAERYVLEKPFGRDTESCAALVSDLSALKARDTFFIDHYLGKELVMNLFVLRFANVCFGALWNRHHIKSVQVIFKEKLGVEGRAYFDHYGIMRDVMQNHLLQMMAMVAMEQPSSLSAKDIRAEKLKLLRAVTPLALADLVTGQYTSSDTHVGYREEACIANKASNTETFAVAVLYVNNPRWDGVPFVLKAGKALTDSKVELRIQFHQVPGMLPALGNCAANELVVRVQPEEAIYWKVQNKVPGLEFKVEQLRMDLLYKQKFVNDKVPPAYERLLLEVLANDHSHFVSAEELDAQWRIFSPALHEIEARQIAPDPYPFGSRGPPQADHLAQLLGLKKFGGGLTEYVFQSERIAQEQEQQQ